MRFSYLFFLSTLVFCSTAVMAEERMTDSVFAKDPLVCEFSDEAMAAKTYKCCKCKCAKHDPQSTGSIDEDIFLLFDDSKSTGTQAACNAKNGTTVGKCELSGCHRTNNC